MAVVSLIVSHVNVNFIFICQQPSLYNIFLEAFYIILYL